MIAISNPEINFKRAPGGWVFRAPNPWVLVGSSHYLVSDDQKNRIIDALTPPYGSQMAAVAFLSFLAWCATIIVVLAGFGQAIAPASVVVVAMLSVALPVPAWAIVLAATQRHRLKPVLVNAPLTDQRITLAEMRSADENSTAAERARSLWKGNAGLCVVFAWLAISSARRTTFEPVLFILASLYMAWDAVRWYRISKRPDTTGPTGG